MNISAAISYYNLEADLLTVLAHPVRLQILDVLRSGETCVCHIQAVLEQRQAYVSQQLMVLRRAGLVVWRKEGLRVFYQISNPALVDLLDQTRQWTEANRRGRARVPAILTPRKPCPCPRCAAEPKAGERPL
ncbi:MAG TPA: metalloregulator ArsR/SmtB family transcription factor [Anaerolineales bacterium]|nr:metalloregulator ArsR/SmtB family transcription factor [Anaerolineales bacterium]